MCGPCFLLFPTYISLTILSCVIVGELSGPILEIEGMGAFFWGTIFWKKGICLLAPPKQMSFSTISHKNIFLKTQGTKLGAIIAPNKVLE